MRGKFIIAAVLSAVMLLSGCDRNIRGPADELRMYGWQSELEGGNTVTLSFDGSDATLSADGGVDPLLLEGLCAVTDDTVVICDSETGYNYSFGYKLYGDRVELSIFDSEITLKKLP